MAAAGTKIRAATQGGGRRKITLFSSDRESSFRVPEAVTHLSGSLRSQIETGFLTGVTEIELELRDVSATTLAIVVEYLRRKIADDAWDDHEFIGANVGQELLYDILYAAINLNLEGLIDLACKRAADMIRGKGPAEIRRIFRIDHDGFTPEQREEIRRDSSWINM